jgi:hypothetical protein
MHYRRKRYTLLVSLLGISGVCHAQSIPRPTFEIDLDFRSRIAAVGRSRTALYSGSLRMNAPLAPGLSLEVYGTRKYHNFLPAQATLQKDWGAQRLQVGVLRVPFGIYDARETYASGLIDYPMPRLDYGLNSVNWGVPGVQWTGGNARWQLEAAAFEGRAYGEWGNLNNVGGSAFRLQTYARDLILGASYWDGYLDTNFRRNWRGPIHLSGIDMRYTRPHLLLRGEYLFGTLNGSQMHGWYLDAYYHLPKYAKWTLVARLEELKPGSSLPLGKQVTFGFRYTADPRWIFAVNWRRNNGSSFYPHSWTPYAGRGGDLFFQIYRKIRF